MRESWANSLLQEGYIDYLLMSLPLILELEENPPQSKPLESEYTRYHGSKGLL